MSSDPVFSSSFLLAYLVHMSVDCFVVEVRHVASRLGENDVSIQIGMFVRFVKSCLFENKIKVKNCF